MSNLSKYIKGANYCFFFFFNGVQFTEQPVVDVLCFLAKLTSNQADMQGQKYFCTHVFDDKVALIAVCHF